ncbi:amino acid adenylation domain-containing protein [Lysobacter sp. F60174L2]|uniref:amino acid adenylation domain-containing protein n=1 Tax=Lysobacter sp. F60174L2 TaxID=3459295 RepID=UPI00403DF066
MQPAAHSAVDYDPFADGELARVVSTTEPQREVWLADQLGEDASLAFNESSSLRLRGSLDRRALHAALEQLVARHDALRSSFGPDGESLCVRPATTLALPFTDLSAMDAAARDAALAARLRSVVETPFRLDRDELFRAELLRLSDDEHLLVLTAHHIVCDGWSWWVLVQDLGMLYAVECGTETGPLPPAEAFSDYAVAEAAHVAGKASAADEAYWLSRFADGAPVLDLPTDRPRPHRRSFASRREDHVIDADLVAAVRRMGARRGTSMFATLLAGFASVVSRIAGQSQVVVGIPAAGQSVDGHDHLVGHCVNLLPLRFDLDPAQPFQQLLGDAQDTLLDAIEHQRYTFGTLLQKVKLERDPARLPLVSVMFNIDQALERETTGFPGLSMDFRSNPRSYENFEIFINAVHAHGALTLECQYNTDLFDADTIRRWLSAYEALLRDAVERPEAAAASLSLVDADAIAELAALQPAPVEFDRQLRMHESFEVQCDRDPDRVALEFRGESLSYATLEARANRIAHLLRARGVKRGGLVGIALDRGVDMLAGLLGVLKAGAGYVPLDPQFPAERLAYMAGDAGLAALLTQQRHAGQFDLRGRPVLMLDQLDEELASMPTGRIGRDEDAAEPESVAYVIYTSGSTGRPKGVQVPHRAVANFLVGMQREPGIGPDDRLVAVTTLSFDIAVLELLLPLSVGARVVLADRDTAVDGGALKALLVDSGATLMQATPATWRLLLEADWAGHPAFAILCGGEPLPADLATQLLPRCGALWNVYGPTETTVWSTIARVEQPAGQNVPDIHIGHPIANTRVWIVDEQGGLCPRGVAGEICIGGDGVTLGYLQRPELTADRFVPDRFAGAPPAQAGQAAALLYRTGDRGRWRADGNLEHLGRLDFQVKVRGYRIELGEIENNLASHADVARVVVIAREDRPGDVRLVAYVVPQPGREVDESALVAHLRGALPDYMIPQHVMALDAVPLLPNGKVNRKGLPAPDTTLQRKTDSVAPRNELERRIATTMASVLGVAEIGVEDDFFAAGGHSLLAAQLTSRLNRELGVALSLRALFDAPTVARLARRIDDSAGEPAPVHAPIPRRPDQSRAPLSLIQERLRMLEEFNPGQPTYNTPSAHVLNGPLDAEVFERAFRAMVQRQTVLRTTIGEEDGEPVQIVHDDFDTGLLPVVDMRSIPADRREAELDRQLAALVAVPFDLGKPPLFTARLYRMDEQRHVLMFMPHHIVWDGWSFDLLYTDIAGFYQAFLDGREPDLPELPVTYGDFAAWHREWVKGPEYAAQLDFWRTRLGGANLEDSRRVRALPTDHPRRPGMSGRASSHKFEIPAALAEQLRESGLKIEATMFVTLLAAYFTLLHGVSGQNNLIVATPVRGRHRPEVEAMMGYFANLLPLRIGIDPSVRFADVVKATKDLVLDSLGNPDIRLEDLMSELSVRTASGGRMLYQSLFSFQDIRQRELNWGNVTHERRALPHPGVTEDLAIWFVEEVDKLSAAVVYNTELFRPESADLLHQRYLAIIEAVAADPFQPIAALTRFENLAPLDLKDWDAAATATVEPLHTAADAAAAPAPAGSTVTDDDPLLARLALVWSELVGLESVAPDDDFFALGGNSLQAVQMFQAARQLTGTNLPLATLLAAPTLRGLTAAYRNAGAVAAPASIPIAPVLDNPVSNSLASRDPWAPLVPIRTGGTRPPLFLAHAVGGNVLNYQHLAKKLPADQPVYGLQAIGLDGRTPPLQRVEDMARRYVAEIRQVQPEGPYRLAGGSMGGIIAFEMAQQLVAAGQQVSFLGLIDTSADYGERCRREALGGWRVKLRNRMAGRSWRQRWAVLGAALASRKRRLALRLKTALARRIGAEIPHADRYAGIEAVHRQAYEQYAVRPYPGRVVLFRASEQPTALDRRPTLGWEQLVEAVEVIPVDGSHVGLVEAPEMAPSLAQALAAAPNGHASARQEATGVSAVAAVDDPRVRYLMALWKELLDADVAPGDNFFDAGGHSMLAVQMTDRVYRERGVRLNMMRLASWTLSQLAAELPASTDESSRRLAAAHGAPDGRQPASTSGLARMLGSPEAASQ